MKVCHVRSSLWCVPFSVPLFIHFLTMYYLSQAPFAHPVSFVFVIGSGFVSCNKLSHDVRQNIVVTSPGHACPFLTTVHAHVDGFFTQRRIDRGGYFCTHTECRLVRVKTRNEGGVGCVVMWFG